MKQAVLAAPFSARVARAAAVSLCVSAALWQAPLGAQQTLPPASGAGTRFGISGFELTGDVPLDGAETARILAPFIGPGATLNTLQKATTALEARFAEKGYALHRVSLPAQELGGKVSLQLVKFVVGKVSVAGNQSFSEANIRASLPELREGTAPNFRTLAVQTAIANENPAKQVQVTVKESEEADRIDAQVSVREGRPWNVSLSASNSGTDSTGNDRSTLVLSHANLWGRDHQASVAFTTSVERSDAVKQWGLNYRAPFYALGSVLALNYTNSDVVGNFGTFTSTGAGQTLGASWVVYRAPQGGYRSHWSLGLEEKIFNAARINGAPVFGQVDRSSRPLSLGFSGRRESDESVWSYDAQVLTNLAGDAGNTLAAYRAEDPRINNVQWTALRGGGSYLAPLPGGATWNLRGQWQYSGDALIAGEQFGLGGTASVRGASERNTSGDSGLSATLEISTGDLRPGLRLHGFADAGWLSSNNTSAIGAVKPTVDQLASYGVGLRLNSGLASLVVEWGQVVTGATQPAGGNPNLARAGAERWHVNLSARF